MAELFPAARVAAMQSLAGVVSCKTQSPFCRRLRALAPSTRETTWRRPGSKVIRIQSASCSTLPNGTADWRGWLSCVRAANKLRRRVLAKVAGLLCLFSPVSNLKGMSLCRRLVGSPSRVRCTINQHPRNMIRPISRCMILRADPTYEPPRPVTEPTPNPAGDPPPEIPGDPPSGGLRLSAPLPFGLPDAPPCHDAGRVAAQ
jgi:hypothetical protein